MYKHFKLNTGYAEVSDAYHLLADMAEKWEARQIRRVRVFFANLVDVYISVDAKRWYHWSNANDPDYPGDAEDIISGHPSFQYHYKTLSSRPRPETRWRGKWQEFDSAVQLRQYCTDRLERMGKPCKS